MSRGMGRSELSSVIAGNPRVIGALRGTIMAGFLSKSELEALVTGSVQTADIADGAITNAKVAAAAAIAHSKLGTGVIKSTIIAGGAAGDHTVTGIETGDSLVAVLFIDATDASETYSDLTGEFSISAADTINNAGGTDTTGGGVVVIYEDRTP
jgi:hypothetical protein